MKRKKKQPIDSWVVLHNMVKFLVLFLLVANVVSLFTHTLFFIILFTGIFSHLLSVWYHIWWRPE